MAPSYDHLRVRLIQVRERPAVIQEEQQTFLERCHIRPEQLLTTSALAEPLEESILDDVDAVMIGGAGAYSVTHTYPWTGDLIRLVEACYERHLPLFGSCWGHQFIARAFGGTVIKDVARSEMGTQEVSLTDAGADDPLFHDFPHRFSAQMGHQDRVSVLPDQAVELARNDTAPFQAFRIKGRPIYGTQFHSELDAERERQRLVAYRAYYTETQSEAEFERTVAELRDTPEVDGLLSTFLRRFAVAEHAV
ncbi:MAG: type 1 glutamine amidotransferase [Bacteroidota bacterium]